MPTPYDLPTPRSVAVTYPGHLNAMSRVNGGLDEDRIDPGSEEGEALLGALEDLIDQGLVSYVDHVYRVTLAGQRLYTSIQGESIR